jgi:hypothetical protein
MSSKTEHYDNDVLILFPEAKVSTPKEEQTDPVSCLVEEVEQVSHDYIGLPCFNESCTNESLAQLTDSLEVRLNVLEEVQSRLKFYLDDIEKSPNLKK